MFRTGRTRRLLALAGVVGPLVWWVLVALNGSITPDYSHVGDFISTLGAVGAPYAALQVLNFAVLGTAIVACALGLHSWLGDGRRPRAGTVLLAGFGVGVLLAGVFPEDPAAPASTTSVLHDAVSTVAFLFGIVGVALLSRRLASDRRWPSVRAEATGWVVVVVATFLTFMGSIAVDSPYVGITQRLFIGVMTLWVAVQSLRLVRASREDRETARDRQGAETGREPADRW